MKRTERTLLAVLFGPILGATLGILVFGGAKLALSYARYGDAFPGPVGVLTLSRGGGVLVGVLFGIPAMVLAGLPTHAFFYHRGLHSPLLYVFAGALAGLLTALVAGQLGLLFLVNSDLPPGEEPLSDFMAAVWVFPQAAILGACCAFCFWLIRRPDRDAANPATATP